MNSNNKKKSGGTGWGVLIVLVILIIRGLSNGTISRQVAPAAIALIVIAVLIAVVAG